MAGRRWLTITPIVRGTVSIDAKEYMLTLSGNPDVINDPLTRWRYAYDDRERILTVRIAWKPEMSTLARQCILEYRLTPEGFIYIDPNEVSAASAPAKAP